MATYTSKANGNYGSGGQTTWNESGVPGLGDRVVITHAITIAAPAIAGESRNSGISGTGTCGTGGASSATLTGSGTSFDTELRVGDYIIIGANVRVVTAIASATSLTMSAAATIANGTAFTYTPTAVFLSGTSARLIVNDTFSVLGAWAQNYPSTTPVDLVTVAAGVGIEFDAGGSPGTSATKYPIGFMAAGNQYGTWKFNGTSGSRSYLRTKSSSSGGNAYITLTGQVVGGWLDASYTDFSKIGDSSNDGYPYYLGNTGNAKLILNRCTVDNCGQWQATSAPHASATLRITGTRFTNPLHATYSLVVPTNSNSATCVIEKHADGTYCYFEKTFKPSSCANWVIGGAIFKEKPETGGSARWTSWDDTWVRQTADTWAMLGNITNSVLYYDKAAGTNPHFLGLSSFTTGATDLILSGNAFYFNGTSVSGNCLTHNSSGGTAIGLRIRNNLFLPNSAGTTSGAPLETGADLTANYKIYFTHNTAWIDGQWGIEIGHLQTAVESPNRWGELSSNLWIGGVGSDRYVALNVDSDSEQDLIPPSVIDKNARYLCLATNVAQAGTFTNQGNSYAAKFSTTPGGTDINLDASSGPAFVGAPTGTPATSFLSQWSTSLGGAGTDADAWANVAAGTAGYTPAAFLTYLQTQCKPTNALLKDAGADGVTIGALEGVFATGGGGLAARPLALQIGIGL